MAERTKRSKVWLYFTRVDSDNARCLKCNKVFASKGGNTSGLSKHLAKVHHTQMQRCTVFDKLKVGTVEDTAIPSTSSGNYNVMRTYMVKINKTRLVNIIQSSCLGQLIINQT